MDTEPDNKKNVHVAQKVHKAQIVVEYLFMKRKFFSITLGNFTEKFLKGLPDSKDFESYNPIYCL